MAREFIIPPRYLLTLLSTDSSVLYCDVSHAMVAELRLCNPHGAETETGSYNRLTLLSLVQ
jgi:hypothetical protein